MSADSQAPVRVALLDLYKGTPNQGIRCIRQHLKSAGFTATEFDIRGKMDVPGTEFDIYISSGGPGSPFDGEGEAWEAAYFDLLDSVREHNLRHERKKAFLAICHSFQLMARHFGLADVEPRKSGSFGILPVHLTDEGVADPLFSALPDPFWTADFREWQVLRPRDPATVLAIEKDRPHVPLERAVMAMRVSDEIVGTQFHPEADPDGMLVHFTQPAQKAGIVDKHGADKYADTISRLRDPDYLARTHDIFFPRFLELARAQVRPVSEPVTDR